MVKRIEVINNVKESELRTYNLWTKELLKVNLKGWLKVTSVDIVNTWGSARGKHHDIEVYVKSMHDVAFIIESSASSVSHAHKFANRIDKRYYDYKGGNHYNYTETITKYWLDGDGLNEWLDRMTKKELYNIFLQIRSN